MAIAAEASRTPAQRQGEYVRSVLAEYAGAIRLAPVPSRGLSPAGARFGSGPGAAPACEYFPHTGEIHLFNLLPPAQMAHAVLAEAFAEALAQPVGTGGARAGAEPQLLDVKPRDIASIEHCAACLYAPELRFAQGTRWRVYLTLTAETVSQTVEGAYHGNITAHRFLVSLTL